MSLAPVRRGLKLAALAALTGLGGCAAEPQSDSAPSVHASSAEVTDHLPQRVFISGHSLTDRPFPDYLEALALAEGNRLEWNRQNVVGSSLRMRTQNNYRTGTDKYGEPINVLDELTPKEGVAPYDTLILTEVHTLLESLVWNDTIGNAVDYYRRFTERNPGGRVYLYSSWLGVDDMDDPRRWIAYERAAAKAWQCVASRINQLAVKGNARHVQIIPAAEAVAALVEQAVSREAPLFDGTAPRAAMREIFIDDVHLTKLGSYYVALVSYAVLHGELPQRLWAPEMDPNKAKAVQEAARRFIAGWSQPPAMASSDCAEYLAGQFTPVYLGYARDTQWSKENWARARYKWARYSIEWPAQLRSDAANNPFRDDTGGH